MSIWLRYGYEFLGGVFLTNAIPHFVSGVCGRSFQSPFASPPGQGRSSSTSNVVWASMNIVAGYALLRHIGDFSLGRTDDAIAFGLGLLVFGLFLARYFGRYHGGNSPPGS
jgi:hypothetical protein